MNGKMMMRKSYQISELICRPLCGLLALFLSFAALQSAKAEVFVWKDAEFEISFVYPDLWREQLNGNPDVRLDILAPQAQDLARCKIFAKEDKRYMMYPQKYNRRINSIVYNMEGVRQHYIEKDTLSVITRDDFAGIGRADAVFAEVRFIDRSRAAAIPMQGLMFATLNGDMNFVIECEAAARNFEYWRPIFLNMVKSVDFPLWQDIHPHGLYPYNITEEGDILLSTDNAKTGTLKY